MTVFDRREILVALGATGLGLAGTHPARAADDKPVADPLAGAWTYRSFLNNPDPKVPFNDLEFATAQLTIRGDAAFGVLAGRLSFGGDALALKGTVTYGNPFTLRFQGTGDSAGTKDWVYDYLGFLATAWPNGVDQRPAIVGTIVRSVAHSDGKAKAGVVASFIAVKQDPGK
jgi:hypothetical protein